MAANEVKVKEFKSGPRAQLEWGFGGRRRLRDGALLIALFVGGIGAGQFIISTSVIESTTSALIGLLVVGVGKTVAHLVYLGRPERFYRMFLRPQSSWISRGLIFMIFFVMFAAGYLGPELGFDWLPWTTDSTFGQLLWMGALAAGVLVMVYDGFAMASCKSIASWHTALLPVLFFVYSLAGGIALTVLTTFAAGDGALDDETMLTLDAFLLISMLALVVIYMMNLKGSTKTAKESLRLLTRSSLAFFFIGLAILAGLGVPLTLAYLQHVGDYESIASGLLAASAVFELTGDISVRHSILRTGLHAPFVDT
jgi:formate-dependent nitrite reductase membrane component NrfD